MGGGNVCGAESRTHYLFRIGETFRRRGFRANFGTGTYPMTILDSAPLIKVGLGRGEGVAWLLDSLKGVPLGGEIVAIKL